MAMEGGDQERVVWGEVDYGLEVPLYWTWVRAEEEKGTSVVLEVEEEKGREEGEVVRVKEAQERVGENGVVRAKVEKAREGESEEGEHKKVVENAVVRVRVEENVGVFFYWTERVEGVKETGVVSEVGVKGEKERVVEGEVVGVKGA